MRIFKEGIVQDVHENAAVGVDDELIGNFGSKVADDASDTIWLVRF